MNRSLKHHLRWWPAIGAICIGVTAPSLNPYLLHVVFMVLIYAHLGLAWNIVSGMGGQLSLGHALYLGTGAYTSMLLFLHFGISPWIGMWIGGILAAGLAALIGAITFRSGLAHDYYVLSTIAVAQVAMIAVANTHFLGGASGLSLPYVADSWWNMQMNSKLGYVADSYIELQAMRQLNYYTASRADSHGDLQKVTFQTAAAVNKLFCLERALQIVDRCMQVHGAMGMTQEYPFEYLHRQLKSARAAEGSPQIMRHIVATDLLGKEITQLTPKQ